MYPLCASGIVNMQGFAWKFLCAIYTFFFSFIAKRGLHEISEEIVSALENLFM